MARIVTDPLALAVKSEIEKILGHKAYSSARISGGTVHRTSWPIDPPGLPYMRYPKRDDLTVGQVKIINKFVAGVDRKLSKSGLDMDQVKLSWHFGAGLYLNVRVNLLDD